MSAVDKLLRANVPGLPENIKVETHASALLKDGFVVVVAIVPLPEDSSVEVKPRGEFLHDRGWVNEPSAPEPQRHVLAVNEATGEVVPLENLGRAWNFEHEPTVEEVFALLGAWDPESARKAERGHVYDEYHDPKLSSPPAIVNGSLTFALYDFSNNSGSHYTFSTIQLPKTEEDGLQSL